MTKQDKFRIEIALQNIAMAVDDKTLDRIKDRLETIEEIVSKEPDSEGDDVK